MSNSPSFTLLHTHSFMPLPVLVGMIHPLHSMYHYQPFIQNLVCSRSETCSSAEADSNLDVDVLMWTSSPREGYTVTQALNETFVNPRGKFVYTYTYCKSRFFHVTTIRLSQLTVLTIYRETANVRQYKNYRHPKSFDKSSIYTQKCQKS